MKKDILICLVGPTCSGKTTLITEILKKLNLNYIESFTSRSKRNDNEKGHIFSDKKRYVEAKKQNEVFGYAEYLNNFYWMEKNQYQNKGISIFPIEPIGFLNIKKEIKDAKIIGVYLETNEKNIRERLIQRSYNSKVDNIENIINNDKKLFVDNENLKKNIDYIIDNNLNICNSVSKLEKIIYENME